MAILKETDKVYRELTDIRLLTSSRLNLYNILVDKPTNVYFNNLFRSIEISNIMDNNNYFDIYTTEMTDWWDNISDKFYGTSTLWYLLCVMNKIINPYEEIDEGQQIKVLKKEYLYNIFRDMKNISKL
jgi:hypothetical protein